MENIKRELKQHPSYWVLHKKFWQEEYDNLDRAIAERVVSDPKGREARMLEYQIHRRIKADLLQRA